MYTFFGAKSLKSRVYFTLISHFNSHAKCSSEMFDESLDFVRFTIEKVDFHTHVALNALKSFPVTEF